MDLTPYLETLRADLHAAAAPGGPDTVRAAELLGGALEASARLVLLEALSDAAAQITTRLDDTSVEVRLRGREADLVVDRATGGGAEQPDSPAAEVLDGGDLIRLTLRMPEALKTHVERLAAEHNVSVNAWLVRAIASAVGQASRPAPPPGGRGRPGKRLTGFFEA